MAKPKVTENSAPAKGAALNLSAKPIPRLSVIVSGSPSRIAKFTDSVLVALECRQDLDHEDREVFMVLHLNTKNEILAKETISIGSQSCGIVHPREVFKGAVLHGSSAIICVHNHPSGDWTPSVEDIEITRRLVRVGEIIGIRVLDHIILGKGRHFSFVNSGTMPSADFSVCERKAELWDKREVTSPPDVSCELGMIEEKLELLIESVFENKGRYEKLGEIAKNGVTTTLVGINNDIRGICEKLYPTN